MGDPGTIREGMEVYGADAQRVGTVERLDAAALHVGGHPVPRGAVARVEQGRVYLHVAAPFVTLRHTHAAPPGAAATRRERVEGERAGTAAHGGGVDFAHGGADTGDEARAGQIVDSADSGGAGWQQLQEEIRRAGTPAPGEESP